MASAKNAKGCQNNSGMIINLKNSEEVQNEFNQKRYEREKAYGYF